MTDELIQELRYKRPMDLAILLLSHVVLLPILLHHKVSQTLLISITNTESAPKQRRRDYGPRMR